MQDRFIQQTFDCVLKSLKIRRHARRPHWDDGYELFIDNDGQLKYIDLSGNLYVCSLFSEKDILAEDWEVLL